MLELEELPNAATKLSEVAKFVAPGAAVLAKALKPPVGEGPLGTAAVELPMALRISAKGLLLAEVSAVGPLASEKRSSAAGDFPPGALASPSVANRSIMSDLVLFEPSPP